MTDVVIFPGPRALETMNALEATGCRVDGRTGRVDTTPAPMPAPGPWPEAVWLPGAGLMPHANNDEEVTP